MIRAVAALLIALTVLCVRTSAATEPAVPPGLDPGGIAIALLGGDAARICSNLRKHVVDHDTGNYFTAHGAYNIPVRHKPSEYI